MEVCQIVKVCERVDRAWNNHLYLCTASIDGKIILLKYLKIQLNTDLKIILLDSQNNYVEYLNLLKKSRNSFVLLLERIILLKFKNLGTFENNFIGSK